MKREPHEFKSASKGWYSRGYLPHCDEAQLTQFVTFHLGDSLPQTKLDEWREELKFLPKSQRENERRSRIMRFLDTGHGECWLRNPEVAEMVENAFHFFDGERYRLCAWVVMPNHVHTLFEMAEVHSLASILKSWKGYTSHEANKILGRSGDFWYREYYDRYMRDEEHYRRVVGYIENNPVKAGLCSLAESWRWSSASRNLRGEL